MVRQCPCGAKPRSRAPFAPHPRSGAMVVLIQVSSMKTRRPGSRSACQDRQRRRLWTTSERACSLANSVFFEPQSLASQELPHRIVRDLDPACGQFSFQAMQRQMRCLAEPLHDERAVRLENTLAVSAPLCRPHPSRSPDSAATTSPPTTPPHQTAPPPLAYSPPPQLRQSHVLECLRKEVSPSDAGLRSSQHLESQPPSKGNPFRFNQHMKRSSAKMSRRRMPIGGPSRDVRPPPLSSIDTDILTSILGARLVSLGHRTSCVAAVPSRTGSVSFDKKRAPWALRHRALKAVDGNRCPRLSERCPRVIGNRRPQSIGITVRIRRNPHAAVYASGFDSPFEPVRIAAGTSGECRRRPTS